MEQQINAANCLATQNACNHFSKSQQASILLYKVRLTFTKKSPITAAAEVPIMGRGTQATPYGL